MYVLFLNSGLWSNIFNIITWEYALQDEEIIVPYFIDRHGHNDEYVPLDDKYEPDKNCWFQLFKMNHPEIGDVQQDFIRKYNFPFKDGYPCKYPSPLDQYNGYPCMDHRIYFHSKFGQIRKIYNEWLNKWCVPNENLEKQICADTETIRKFHADGKTIMAMMIRVPCHFQNSDKSYDFNTEILPEIIELSQKYDYVLCITLVDQFLDTLKLNLGTKFLTPENRQLKDINSNIFRNDDLDKFDFLKELMDSYTDVYTASQCDFIIGCSSNMLLGALSLNPNVNFKIYNRLRNVSGG